MANQHEPPTSVGAALRALRAAGKSNRGAPFYSRIVNRPLGRVFAAVAFRAGLTPNQVTAISACCTFAGILTIALVQPTLVMGFVVSFMLVIGYALDSADGQLARLRGGGSVTGEWLDHMIDSLKNSTIHAAVLVSFYRFFDFEHDELLLIPMTFSTIASVQFFRYIFTEKMRGAERPAMARDDASRPSLLRSLIALPSDHGLLCVIMVTLNYRYVFLAGYTALCAGSAAYLVGATVNAYRSMRAIDAARVAR